jgi:transposase
MKTVHEEYNTEEQRSVVRFLWARGLSAKDIHKEIFPVYGGQCLSCKAFHSWVEKFSQRRSKATDDARQGVKVSETAIVIFLCRWI